MPSEDENENKIAWVHEQTDFYYKLSAAEEYLQTYCTSVFFTSFHFSLFRSTLNLEKLLLIFYKNRDKVIILILV